jgi:hypothetical protein
MAWLWPCADGGLRAEGAVLPLAVGDGVIVDLPGGQVLGAGPMARRTWWATGGLVAYPGPAVAGLGWWAGRCCVRGGGTRKRGVPGLWLLAVWMVAAFCSVGALRSPARASDCRFGCRRGACPAWACLGRRRAGRKGR